MPMNQGSYNSPNMGHRTECDCYLGIDDDASSMHSSGCSVSKADFLDLRDEMNFGSSLPSFAYEWDAIAQIEESSPNLATSREVADYPEFAGYLLAALLEEQRTANLIAIANDDGFRRGAQILARDTVLERLDVGAEILDQVEEESATADKKKQEEA